MISRSNRGRARMSFLGISEVESWETPEKSGAVELAPVDIDQLQIGNESIESSFPCHIRKCSTMGPRESAGKKVSAPTMITTPTTNPQTDRRGLGAYHWSQECASWPPGCPPPPASE